MWPYLKAESLQVYLVKMRWVLIQSDWCPYKKGEIWTHRKVIDRENKNKNIYKPRSGACTDSSPTVLVKNQSWNQAVERLGSFSLLASRIGRTNLCSLSHPSLQDLLYSPSRKAAAMSFTKLLLLVSKGQVISGASQVGQHLHIQAITPPSLLNPGIISEYPEWSSEPNLGLNELQVKCICV